MTAQDIIDRFDLVPLPDEGGFFRETYRSEEVFSSSCLPTRYTSERAFGTCIYYLITKDSFSALHRVSSEEIFHFYGGDPAVMAQLYPDGTSKQITIGNSFELNEFPQVIVPRNVWQGLQLISGGCWALLGCTVAPGFEDADYEHGKREELIREYPDCKKLIEQYT